MNCSIHPNRLADKTCASCNKYFCDECLVDINGVYYCKEDAANLVNRVNPNYDRQYGYENPNYSDPRQSNVNNYHYHYDAPQYYPYKNRLVALLLCIFLGLGGVHRFYVGKVGTGILYLLTGGLFGIGWVIDIILIALGSFRDKYGYPLI